MSRWNWKLRLALPAVILLATPLAAMAQDWRYACADAATDRGYRVVDFSGAREIKAGDEAVVALNVQMVVESGGDRIGASCFYRIDSRRASVKIADTGRRDEPRRGDRRRVSEAEIADICVRAAQREGFRVRRVVEQRTRYDQRRQPLGADLMIAATRGSTEYGVQCSYSDRSGRASLEWSRRR